MKTQSKWLIACTSICLVCSPALAAMEFGLSASENDYNSLQSTYNPPETTVQTTTFHRPAFTESRQLIGATVRDPQGQRLGSIHDIVVSPRNGEAFAAIHVRGNNYALVPVQAMTVNYGTGLLGRTEVTLNSNKETLESGPTIVYGDWAQLDSPSFTQNIYSHYQLQPPAAVGGAGAGSLGGSSTGQEKNPTQQ